jgi:hypothetical protein
VTPGPASGLLAGRRRRTALLAAGAAGAVALAAAPGDLAPGAVRAALAVLAVAAVAALVRGARPEAPAAQRLSVVSARALARDAGVALVVVDGRELVVGFGAAGVRLVADLGGHREDGAP